MNDQDQSIAAAGIQTAPGEVFDIASMAVNETGIVDLETATGDPLIINGVQASVTVFSPGTKNYQRATAKRNRSVIESVRKGSKKMKDEDQRNVDATFLADCTASFNGFKYKDYTGYDQYREAYLDPKIGFIAEQVQRALGDWANFSKKATTP